MAMAQAREPFDAQTEDRRGEASTARRTFSSPNLPAYIRNGFIRKVYSILCVQLFITSAIGGAFMKYATPEWAAKNSGLYLLGILGSLVLLVGVTCCCPTSFRTFPANYILLLLLTLFQSAIVGFVCLEYTGASVALAVVTTAVVFACLTAYACCTKSDFTGIGAYLMTGLFCMVGFGFVMMIWSMFAPVPEVMHLVYAFCGVILFCFYIVYDTQLIIGGRHKSQEIGVDDYCFAALNLYLDIINLFIFLLRIFGDRR